MKNLIAAICLLGALFLNSCGGEPRMDGTSPESFKASIKKVGESLPLEERKQFAGIIVIYMAGTSLNDSLNGKDPDQIETIRKNLHGKTGREVIAFFQEEMKKKNSKSH